MRAELSPRVQTVVEEALDLPAGERAAYLARYCGADAELRSAVETLVASDALANEGFLARPVLRPRPAALAELELRPAAAARWIGPYELLAKLGEGGMSSVYAARCVRGQGPDEEVAIKVVRPDLPRAAERFSREERFLQTLRHPYIARLLDTGTTTEGQPYFVMELVDGVSITSHCEVAALDVDERLVLFSRVCEAVEYAHRNLVVHRDLKPSNILVDRDGVPRLLDFGVAALLRGAGESTDPTVSVPPALTPNYAAPEQLARSQITTATDVYSLGVVLYELLTGRRPHEWAGLSEVEILRRWRVEQPPAPSRALARVASQKDEQRRGETRPRRTPRRERLARRCQGDLDNIVLKALRFEPERRYGTVGELAADLRRHLGGLPVSARSATVVYRFGKWLRRNTLLASGAAGLAAATVLILAGTLLHVRSLSRERDAARRAEARALVSEQRAKQVADFLVETFLLLSPTVDAEASANRAAFREELLASAVQRIEADAESLGPVRGKLLHAVGFSYMGLGRYADAIAHLERSVEELENDGAAPTEVAESLRNLGVAYLMRGDTDRAEPNVRRALEIDEAHSTSSDAGLRDSWRTMARLATRQSDFETAVQYARRAIEAERAHGTPAELVENLGALAEAQYRAGDYAAAERTLGEAVTLQRRLIEDSSAIGTPDAEVMNARIQLSGRLSDLAVVRRYLGRADEAAALYREALEVDRAVLGEHPLTATTLNNLGVLLTSRDELAEAEEVLDEALSLRRATLAADDPMIAESLYNLGRLHSRQRRLADARTELEAARDGYRAKLGERHPSVAEAMWALAVVAASRGDLAAAERGHREALERRLESLGDDHPKVAESLASLAEVLRRRGRLEEAEGRLRRSLEIRRRQLGARHASVGATLSSLAGILLERGAAAEAADLAREAVRILAVAEAGESWRQALADVRLGMAMVALDDGDRAEGMRLVQKGRDRLEEKLGPRSRHTLAARDFLARSEARR